MNIFKKTFCIMSLLCLGSLCTFTSCGDDEEDEKIEKPGNDWSDEDGSGNQPSYVNVVGKTYQLYELSERDVDHIIRKESLDLRLSFTSSSSYSITKRASYWKYNNGAYRNYDYNETKTGSYSRSGNTITLKGNWPYWANQYSETWSSDDWEVEIMNENILINDEGKSFVIIK